LVYLFPDMSHPYMSAMTETPTPEPRDGSRRSTDPWPEIAGDRRRVAPAAGRNAAAIHDVLRQVLPSAGTVLEIGSGTGQHAAAFAPALAPRRWLPSDPDAGARASIEAWTTTASEPRPLPPRAIDAAAADWGLLPDDDIAAIVAVNVLHIAPWAVTLGILDGAARHLPTGGPLIFYGPFSRGGRNSAPSNAAFDASLRAQNPEWGVRDLDDVAAEASSRGLDLDRVVDMPANNQVVVFRRQTDTPRDQHPRDQHPRDQSNVR
jgi:SAM-dependent methyltransferase